MWPWIHPSISKNSLYGRERIHREMGANRAADLRFRREFFHVKRAPHNGSEFLERADVPGPECLYKGIACRRCLGWSGDDAPTGKVSAELIQKSVSRASAHYMNHVNSPARELFQQL